MMKTGIVAAITLTIFAFATSAPARAQDAGEAAYAKQCARCHTVAKAVDFMKAHPDAEERGAWLERKLSRHHARDVEERKHIISFMERVYGAAQKKK
jgi:mono/diheme cytochrome c family protein